MRSDADERRIRSFLKVYFIGHCAILVLGYLLAYTWARALIYELGRPAQHLVRAGAILLGVYALTAGIPYFVLWRSYRNALPGFVSPADEVTVAPRKLSRQQLSTAVALAITGLAFILGIARLVSQQSVLR